MIDVVTEPCQHRVGIGAVLGDEVARALKPVHIGLGESVDEVVEVVVAEDRIARTPQHQRRNVEPHDTRGDPLEFAEALVVRVDRNIGDEAADPLATGRRAVRRAIRILHCRVERGRGKCKRRVHERGAVNGGCCEHPPGAGESQRRGDRRTLRMVHGRIQQHDPGKVRPVVDCPAE